MRMLSLAGGYVELLPNIGSPAPLWKLHSQLLISQEKGASQYRQRERNRHALDLTLGVNPGIGLLSVLARASTRRMPTCPCKLGNAKLLSNTAQVEQLRLQEIRELIEPAPCLFSKVHAIVDTGHIILQEDFLEDSERFNPCEGPLDGATGARPRSIQQLPCPINGIHCGWILE